MEKGASAKACVLKVAEKLQIAVKDKQMDAIVSFMLGNDVFVSLPTGYGKSLIYAMLPMAFDLYKEQQGSIVICISPLISLMLDQKSKFQPMGISTEFVGEDQCDSCAISRVLSGDVQLVYISPESIICNPMYRNMLLSPVYKEKLVATIVDEAHCVKTWGDSFRVAYAHLGDTRSLLPSNVKIMALTATATHETYRTICRSLMLKDPVLIGCPPNRHNITYEVKPMLDMNSFCSSVAEEVKIQGLSYPKTIIFLRSYNDCAALYHALKRKLGPYITCPPNYPIRLQFSVLSMYSRATRKERKEKVLALFCENRNLRIILATTAFGMGVDCSDVRMIYHWGPPDSLEEYVQESGRAGRDGQASKAVLLYGKAGKHVSDEVKAYATNTSKCRREKLFKNFLFAEKSTTTDIINCCDVCNYTET